MMADKRILIMAGGTGGHVFPGLAAASSLREMGATVEWLGTENGIEAQLVPAHDIAISFIQVVGIRGKGVLRLLSAPLPILRAVYQACRIIRKVKPDCVLGMGGYAAGPGGVAAWLLRKPLVIHEQNAVAGTTNRILARIADCVLEAFPHTFKAHSKIIESGNPVRAEIAALPTPDARGLAEQKQLRLLVLGGSLGAKAINELLPRVIAQLNPMQRPQLWHQTGKAHIESVVSDYEAQGIEARSEAFIDDMAAAYSWADLVICRAGALTVAELAAAGVGSILIPFPYAIDDHQTRNAQWLADVGAAYLLPQTELDEQVLGELLGELIQQQKKLLEMAQAARELSRPDAARFVATKCLELANG